MQFYPTWKKGSFLFKPEGQEPVLHVLYSPAWIKNV